MTMKIETQLAVFLDNRPGMLARTCQALAKAGINILAMSILDTVDHAIVRMIVNRPRDAETVLSHMHTLVQAREVIVMDVPNQPGSLAKIAEHLTEAGINLEYAYGTCATDQDRALFVLRTSDLEATISALAD